jgi:hypothetical protein
MRYYDAMLSSLSEWQQQGKADRKNVVWEVLILSDYSLQSSVGVNRLSFNFVL